MKHIQTKQIIAKLQAQGTQVGYRKRSDGGYIITSINGVKYKGADGNKVARQLTGYSLSERMQSQRSTATTKRKAYYESMNEEVRKQLNKTQRAWRKHEREGSESHKGKIRAKQVKKAIEKYGVKDTLKWLKEDEKYSKGIAYRENVDTLKARLEREFLNLPNSTQKDKDVTEIKDKILTYLEVNADNIKEEAQLQKIINILYDLGNGLTNAQQAISKIANILNIQ